MMVYNIHVWDSEIKSNISFFVLVISNSYFFEVGLKLTQISYCTLDIFDCCRLPNSKVAWNEVAGVHCVFWIDLNFTKQYHQKRRKVKMLYTLQAHQLQKQWFCCKLGLIQASLKIKIIANKPWSNYMRRRKWITVI